MTSLKYTHLFHSLILNPFDIIILSNFSYYYFATCFNPYKDIYIYIYICRHLASKTKNCHWAFIQPPTMAILPSTQGARWRPLLSRKWCCVVCACVVWGVVCVGLWVLSLSLSRWRKVGLPLALW